MSSADPNLWTVDDRVRAALLWDHPSLLQSSDPGSRQWRLALELHFADLGDLNEGDVLSLAAHVVDALMAENLPRALELRNVLHGHGKAGELFERLLGLSLGPADPASDPVALRVVLDLLDSLADADLKVRLLVRAVAFSHLRGQRELAVIAAQRAIADTSADTRAGVVARRWAIQYGIAIEGFNPWTTDTPDDPLLSLPWVHGVVVDAAASLATSRFERQLGGPWDTSFHIGRSRFDDLNSALVQAEWCGDLALRSNIRQLMSSYLLTEPRATAHQIHWGLVVWASEPSTKRVGDAIRRFERELDAASAAELVADVRRESGDNHDAVIEVAAGVWDVLDDAAADELIAWLPVVGTQRSTSRRNGVLRALLWRRPETWEAAFRNADKAIRANMVAALDPGDLGAAPEDLCELLMEHVSIDPSAFSAGMRKALQFLRSHMPVDDSDLGPAGALELLAWNPASIAPEAMVRLVAGLVAATTERLDQAAKGSFGLAVHDPAAMLGQLASYLSTKPKEVFEALETTCRAPGVPASWQIGALEGLVALRRRGRLDDADVARVRELSIVVGPALLGEEISAEAVRATQLRVIAPRLGADEIAWLAVQSRGSDVVTRLAAISACGAVTAGDTPAVDWSLVGGLFDPDDHVVVRAVASIGRRGIAAESGARPVARKRLTELAIAATASIRREVIVTAVNRAELELVDVVERARDDRAWTVRREAGIARRQG